nr:immunoglobulin heavy chain junction region [Mus musculus]NSM03699.1 immunoglobulin heavy chain junction region [Mus musculus]NSM03752.1 immunoglobulin heavy chain junction region [Mus musculus]NSM03755.1 immunoglobulin heavy chain junction region [Mus musculus]NSM03861.1 immunoglobulin heavy chain junction region [Mus musculus]
CARRGYSNSYFDYW